jgi:hypothetical protein
VQQPFYEKGWRKSYAKNYCENASHSREIKYWNHLKPLPKKEIKHKKSIWQPLLM